MKRLFGILAFGIILISGCTDPKPLVASTASPAATPTVIPVLTATPSPTPEKRITFNISSFNIEYKKEDNSFYNESYTGNGIINALGDESLVKKSYLVLINIKKTSGGAKVDYTQGLRTIIVTNGVGQFSTSDSSFDRSFKMEKPAYDIKILGYLPFSDLQPND